MELGEKISGKKRGMPKVRLLPVPFSAHIIYVPGAAANHEALYSTSRFLLDLQKELDKPFAIFTVTVLRFVR